MIKNRGVHEVAINPDLHWREGLFLHPHHMQRFQRSYAVRINELRQLVLAYPFGVLQLEFSEDALANYIVKIEKHHIVMRSGIEVVEQGNANIPALNIKERFKSDTNPFTIFIGIPLWYGSRANSIEPDDEKNNDWRIKRLYRVCETEYCDENTGENPQAIRERFINARLLLDNEDHTDLEVIPLLTLTHATGNKLGKPQPDNNFVPPSLMLNGSSVLKDWIYDLINQIEGSRKEHVTHLRRTGYNAENIQNQQFVQVLRLQTLTRYATRLPQLLHAPSTTPFQFHLELSELLNELRIFSSDPNDFDLPAYDHDEIGPRMKIIFNRIRSLLQIGPRLRYEKIEFQPEDGILKIELKDEHLEKPDGYYLGIKTREDSASLIQLVVDGNRFKIMAGSQIKKAIYGILVEEDRWPPSELPASRGDLTYFRFRLDKSNDIWKNVKAEKNIAIRWPKMEQSDYQITLYMTVPLEKGK